MLLLDGREARARRPRRMAQSMRAAADGGRLPRPIGSLRAEAVLLRQPLDVEPYDVEEVLA